MNSKEGSNESKIADTELFISKALRIGVVLSASIIGLGLLMLLLSGDSGYQSGSFPTSLFQIFQGLVLMKSYAVILTGLVILIFTPVFRVGISIITFVKEKDYLYVVLTSIVFTILVISFLLGKE